MERAESVIALRMKLQIYYILKLKCVSNLNQKHFHKIPTFALLPHYILITTEMVNYYSTTNSICHIILGMVLDFYNAVINIMWINNFGVEPEGGKKRLWSCISRWKEEALE